MRPNRRYSENKKRSARKFRKNTTRTKRLNLPGLARGGIRL